MSAHSDQVRYTAGALIPDNPSHDEPSGRRSKCASIGKNARPRHTAGDLRLNNGPGCPLFNTGLALLHRQLAGARPVDRAEPGRHDLRSGSGNPIRQGSQDAQLVLEGGGAPALSETYSAGPPPRAGNIVFTGPPA